MDSVTQAGPCVRTNQIDFDEEAVFWARRHLFDIARGNDRRPFCLVVSLSHPHDPYTIPEPWWSRHADHDVPEVAFPDLPDDDPHARRLAWVLGQQTPTPERIRAARRAYLGALAFVDDQFGAVLRTLREARLDDDTVVIVTSDHGDFLGEHGLWFKMSFRPEAARVPLIVHAPRRFASRRVAASVSLADLAPTLCELAGVAVEDALDGRGLIGHLSGLGGHDEVIGEYFAEGAVAPMGMIRRAGTTFVRSPGDPDQILGDGDAAALAAEAARRWDFAGLDAVVRTSQRRRALAAAALRQGARTSWDWQPPRDAGRAYVREHLDLNDIEAMARFPRV
jgi:choline-sulfatase